jgi:hypothetical protein
MEDFSQEDFWTYMTLANHKGPYDLEYCPCLYTIGVYSKFSRPSELAITTLGSNRLVWSTEEYLVSNIPMPYVLWHLKKCLDELEGFLSVCATGSEEAEQCPANIKAIPVYTVCSNLSI